MLKNYKNFMAGKKLFHETAVAFGLIMLVLLVFLAYLFPGISSMFQSRATLPIVILIIFVIVAISFIIIMQIVNPIIKISQDAKKIAAGDLDHEISLLRDDEVGELGEALNAMTQRMKDNMEQLKTFSKTTESINLEINKHILALSNLLQISNLISQNADLKEIVKAGVGNCLASGAMNFGALILKDGQSSEFRVQYVNGPQREELADQGFMDYKVKLGEGILGKAILKQSITIIDQDTADTPENRELKQLLMLTNIVVVPVISKGNVYGLLLTGNDKDSFVYSNSERELTILIAKQIAIAYANDQLKKEVEKLEIIDKLTGLYNKTYLQNRLNEEIKRAVSFQRPCSLVIMRVDRFDEYQERFGRIDAENALIKMGSVIQDSLGEADKAARSGDHEIAVIFPERNKRQSIELADKIRRKVEAVFAEVGEPRRKLTCTGAVTENPIDGITADELIQKGYAILQNTAKESSNQICYKV